MASIWQQKNYYHSSTDSIIEMKTKELIHKEIEVMETALLSESVLAREWLGSEEDEAWKDL